RLMVGASDGRSRHRLCGVSQASRRGQRRAKAVGAAANLHGADRLQAVHVAPAVGADLVACGWCSRGSRHDLGPACSASPPGEGGGEARTQRRQTRGQLTTSEVFCSVTRPEAAAFLIAAYDLSRRGVASGFHVTLMIDHSGGYAVCPGAIVAPVTLCWPATPFVTA